MMQNADPETTTTTTTTTTRMIPDWVMESGVQDSFRKLPYAIAIITTPHGTVGLYSNPTDQQCYRMIARVLVQNAEEMRLNTLQTPQESLAVSTFVAVFKQIIYQRMGLFVQSLHLGNNSMKQCANATTTSDDKNINTNDNDGCGGGGGDSIVQLGNDREPYFYHEHLLLRGDPHRCYFDGAPALGGPPLGVAFQAQSADKGIPPNPSEINALVTGFRQVLQASYRDNDDDHHRIWKQAGCSLLSID